ncbi:MAG: class I SAM-dependent methyltransferase [Rhodospirillales bacterium]
MSQQWNPEAYASKAGFVAELGVPLINWLAPVKGERVLDLGCGDGSLTKRLMETGVDVTGVDASPDQVAAARARGVHALYMRGEALAFVSQFDAVFSNAALHWMKEPALVFANVAKALKPGGRFVAEMGGDGNVATVLDALVAELRDRGLDLPDPWPWFFPSINDCGYLLEQAGFKVHRIDLFERPTELPGPLEDWLDIFAGPFLALVPEADLEDVKAAVARRATTLRGDDGVWRLDYVRLRFAATLP